MERERPGGSRTHTRDAGFVSHHHGPDPVRQSPEEVSAERVATLRRDARDGAANAQKLGTITLRAEWIQQKDTLQGVELKLLTALREREADAAVSDKAREDYQAAKESVEELTRALATSQQPRVKPLVSRELELEAQIGSMPTVEVFAWAVGLSPAERAALAERLREATTVHRSTDRDTFAVALANQLARTRDLHQFQSVLADPARFNLAALQRDQQVRSVGPGAAAGTKVPNAPVPQPDAASADRNSEGEAERLDGPQANAAIAGGDGERETQDPEAVLRRVLDGHDASAGSAPLDASAFAALDPSIRRTLGKRLRAYRPGRGDELGARFARLVFAEQKAIYDALDATVATAPTALTSAPATATAPATSVPAPAPLLGDSMATATAAPIQVPDALKLKPETAPGTAARPSSDHDEKEPPRPDSALRAYVMRNGDDLWSAARVELGVMSFPTATEQFAWKDPRAFADTVLGAMHDLVMKHARSGDLSPLNELLYPARIADELGPMVPFEQHEDEQTVALERAAKMVHSTVPDEKKGYVQSVARISIPAMGLRFAQLVKSAIAGSTVRMTGRYTDAMNDRARAGLTAHDANVRLSESDLITSRPIDRFVAKALVTPNKSGALVAEVVPDASVKPTERTTLRRPKLTWEGTRDKRFWCFVRADLPDATSEEVAAVLYAYLGGESRTYLAYGLAQAGSLFGLPASWAIQFPEARDSAPENVRQGKLPDPASDTIASRLTLVAGSDQADAIALNQAAKTPIGANVDAPQVLAANEDVIVQLAALRTALTPWGLSGDLIPIVIHAVTKRDTLRTAPPSEVMAYAAVVLGQRERLTRIGGSITNTMAAGKQFPGRDAENPVHAILSRYAQAATTAQLADVSEGLIAEAQSMQRGLVVKALQANQLAAMQAMDEMHAGPAMRDPKAPADDRDWMDKQIDAAQGKGAAQRGASKTSGAAARQLGALSNDAQERARVLENTLLSGGEVDADELQRVQLEAQEVALRARLENLNAHLELVADEATAADNAGLAAKLASLGSGKFRGLRDMTLQVRAQLVEVRRDLILDSKAAKPKHGDDDGLTPPPVDVSAKREALTKAQGRFEQLSQDYELRTYLERAYSLIEDQRFRTTLVTFAAIMGFSFAGSDIASAITKGAGRALTTAEGVAEVAKLSLGARSGLFAMKVATETLASASGQVMMTGDSAGKALAENALMSLGLEATAGLIAKDVAEARLWHSAFDTQLARIASVEAKTAMRSSTAAGTVARLVGREAIGISGHAIMGMALGAISQEVLSHLDGSGHAQAGAAGDVNTDAILQAASVAIGRLVHARTGQRRDAMEALARKSGTPEGQQLGFHARQLEELSTALIKAPDAERALDVLADQERLIQQEIGVIDELLARTDHGGYGSDELVRSKAELGGQLGNARDVTTLQVEFVLSGLRELAPGTLWSGTPEDVARAVRQVHATHPDATVHTEGGTTTIRAGENVIELHEVAGPTQAPRSADHAGTRPPEATHELSNTVASVPGSEMRGGTQGADKSSPHSAALLDRAKATASTVAAPGVSDIRPSSKPGTYLVMLADLTWTSIEVTVARTNGTDPAHLVPNSSRIAVIDGIQIRGEHVIQVSERLPLEQVDRVVAHGIARLVDAHRQALHGNYAGHEASVLSPDDRGRIAEISVLARTAASGDSAASAHARAELAMLTEYLGIRDGAPMANERRAAIDAELKSSPEARAELGRALREPLTEVQRKAALDDLAAEQADHQRRVAPHDAPPPMANKPGVRLTREQIEQYANVATRLRHLVSERTLARFRAQQAQHPGQYPRIEGVQIGAGAALGGRDPAKLLVDVRGRWQSDASENIAQVGQQLQELFRARFGDVREVAGPGERIPLDAIRYWEDSLAAQGDVINGRGTLRVEDGKVLLDITPTDNPGTVTLEVGGNVTTAPGFPSENVPGGARNISAGETILSIERALRTLSEGAGPYKDAAKTALARLEQIKTTRDVELVGVAEVLRDASPEMLAAMRDTEVEATASNAAEPDGAKKKTPDRIPVDTALNAAKGGERWSELMTKDAEDGERQVFFSKEANDETIKTTAKNRDDVKRTWVFAGAGGNAVSAAEIILANTHKAEVTLVAQNQPAGLFENGQFRSMAEQHGDAQVAERARAVGVTVDVAKSSKRLHLVLNPDLDFAAPEIATAADGSQRIELRTKDKTTNASVPVEHNNQVVAGDMFVSALGSPGQMPPEIGSLALEARRLNPEQDKPNIPPKERPVWIEADFAKDGERYLGYTVHIRIGSGYRAFEVRGAASRFVPREEFLRMGADGAKDLAKIDQAWTDDAHSKGGNFAGGLGPTALQTAEQHVEKVLPQPKATK